MPRPLSSITGSEDCLVAKQDWGTKRLCQSCATKFYDFARTPILCPKCEAKFDPEPLLKSRRGRTSAAKQAAKPAPAPAPAPKPKPAKDEDGAGKDLNEGALETDDNDDNDEDDGDDSVLVDDSEMAEDDVKSAVGAGGKDGGDEN